MRICFATEYFPPFAPGGAEWSTAAWGQALARRGHRVVVVTPNYGAAPAEERQGVTVRRVPFPVRLRPGQREARWLVHRNRLFYRYFAWHLERAAHRERVEVFHALGKAALVPAWLAARRLGLPVVATVRDLGLLCPLGMCALLDPEGSFDCDFRRFRGKCIPHFLDHYHADEGGWRRVLRRWRLAGYWRDQRLRHAALRDADAVIGVSDGILKMYSERLVLRDRRWVVHTLPPRVPGPTPEEVLAIRRRYGIGQGPLVLYAGKLSLGKGTGVFLEALDLIRPKAPGVRFALAGKGDWPAPEAPDVRRLGSVPQADLFALYAAADVVVVPSVWPEPLSRVIVEAMALARPVVATDIGGSPEIIEHGVTGLLVPVGDPAALASAVSDLLLDPERRWKIGQAARERATNQFEEERIVGKLLAAYRGAGAGARPGSLAYYLGVSYRRKRVDADLRANARYLDGRVLDVGGARRRGAFRPPAGARWIVADLRAGTGADVLADVRALPFRDGAFDAVKATELLEHVSDAAAALGECGRVLRPGGHLVATAPFLERVHGDPHDYARYTRAKWEELLEAAGLRAVAVDAQGGYFTHLAGLLRFLVLRAPAGLRHAGYLFFPLLDLLARLDDLPRVRRSELAAFVGGYLIVARR